MASREIGIDKRSRTKLVALAVMIALAIALLAVQATARLSTNTDTTLRPPVIAVNELPTGPQHGHGPHPHKIINLARSDPGG